MSGDDAPAGKSLQALGVRVFDIPEAEFAELVKSLESKRLRTRQRQSTDMVLEHLRPRLTLARPPRRPTPERLLCLPFEDLLYDPGTRRKALGKIPRRALCPLWAMLAEDLDPGVVRRTADGLKTVDIDDPAAVEGIGRELWSAAATLLRERQAEAVAAKAKRLALIERLGGEDMLDSLEEVALALSVAGPLVALRRRLPTGPVDDFDRQTVKLVAETLIAAAGLNPRAVPHIVYVMMSRLGDPGALLKIFEKLAEEGVGELLGQATGQVSEAIVNQTEDRLIDVREAATRDGADKSDVARSLGRELRTLNRTSATVAKGGRGMTRRLDRVKTELGRIADEVLVEGSAASAAGMIDDLDAPADSVDEESARMRAAEGRITALRLVQIYGDDVGLSGKIKENLAAIETKLAERSETLVAKLRAGDPSATTADLYATVRLMELTAGAEKADRIRRRGLEAFGA